jgi:hypothetical protein
MKNRLSRKALGIQGSYRRKETITQIIVEDDVLLVKGSMVRTGTPTKQDASSYKVQWFDNKGEELSESSVDYHFLEVEFHKLEDK